MSAPQETAETQAERHKPALTGIKISLGVAAGLLIGLIVYIAAGGEETNGVEAKVGGLTLEVTETN